MDTGLDVPVSDMLKLVADYRTKTVLQEIEN
jgi:hypothetical protein